MGNQYNYKHGMYRSPEYKAWCAMKERCSCPTNVQWDDYGGRGIRVCDEWIQSFDKFYEHIGPRPSPKHTLDRLNNDKGYEPGNVRWATRRQQAENTRRTRFLTYNGETRTLREWAELYGINRVTLTLRLDNYGWTLEQALTLKSQKGRRPS